MDRTIPIRVWLASGWATALQNDQQRMWLALMENGNLIRPLWLDVSVRGASHWSHWCRRRGCWKNFDLVKIRQNPIKSGLNLWEHSKTPRKSEQKWRPTCFDLNIMAPEMTWRAFFWRSHGARIDMKSFFLEVTYFEVFFGQVWENPGKIPSHPKKFDCSYTYDWG